MYCCCGGGGGCVVIAAGAELMREVLGRTKPSVHLCDLSVDGEDDEVEEEEGEGGGELGAGLANNSNKLLTYALSALGTGSPSLINDKKRLFFSLGTLGFVSGSRETGGAPKVRQWMRLKQPVRMFSSLLTSVASMCA